MSSIDLTTPFHELSSLFGHTRLCVLCIFCADFLGDLHRAKLWTAHGAEVSGFRAVVGQGFVVELTCPIRIEAQVELIFPAKLEKRFGESVVT